MCVNRISDSDVKAEMKSFASGLIGYTGFVGGTLFRARHFDACFNSANIDEIAGASFDRLVCAGVSAAKWQANQDPECDRAAIARLTEMLSMVTARKLVLLSTIDVYPDPSKADDEDSSIDPATNHAYGRHRYELEQWIARRFENACVIRLPALFGSGLKKNAVYDLLNGNQVEMINPAATFQWYPTARLADDLDRTAAAGLSLVNLFTEPVTMRSVIDAYFPHAKVGPERKPAPIYRLRTKHARLFGGADGHVLDAASVLDALGDYVGQERARTSAPAHASWPLRRSESAVSPGPRMLCRPRSISRQSKD